MIFLFILYYCFAVGYPTPQALSTQSPAGINFIPFYVSRAASAPIHSVDTCNRRSIWNILWTCLTTIFACTWVAIHPNIPGPEDSEWKILSRRLKLMLRGILLPESVVFWAFMQFYAARQLVDKVNQSQRVMTVAAMPNFTTLPLVGVHMNEAPIRWTRTHAFFSIMGGFMLCRSDGHPLQTLPPHLLFAYTKAKAIDWPKISEKEIWDRSKGDYLTKGIVVMQTSWFIVTCVARAIQRLPITELEIITLAYAVLNGVIYFFWWHKPLDIRCPIQVYLKPSYKGVILEKFEDQMAAPAIYVARINPPSTITERICDIFRPISVGWNSFARPRGKNGILTLLADWTGALTTSLDAPLDVGARYMNDTKTRVKTFFAPADFAGEYVQEQIIYCVFLVVLGSVFGGIHLAGWSLQFPTEAEKWIWRASSLTTTVAPLTVTVPILMILLSSFIEKHTGRPIRKDGIIAIFGGFVLIIFDFFPTIAYFFARLLLLILPLISLRSLPPEAFTDVEWTSFVPHIG